MVLFACHTFAIEAHNTKKFITEELGLPYIRIDTDFSTSDSAQIQTRLESFLEMIS